MPHWRYGKLPPDDPHAENLPILAALTVRLYDELYQRLELVGHCTVDADDNAKRPTKSSN
jgi:hypothetical protein